MYERRSKTSSSPSRLSETDAAQLPAAETEELVLRAQAGDRAATEELAETFGPQAFRLAFQLLGNREDARDVTQDALIRFLTTLDRFEARRPVLPWLRRIVRNLVVDLHRRRRVRRADSLDTDGPEGEAVDVLDTRPGPRLDAERRQLQRDIWHCLHRLTTAHREILVLRDYQDLAYREIAETLEIPIGTVMSRLHAARKKLRDVLLEEGVWSE